jgi:hypothetical protein
MMRTQTTLYQHAQYRPKKNTQKDKTDCVYKYFTICKETGVQLDKEHRYEHVKQSEDTPQEGKVTTL